MKRLSKIEKKVFNIVNNKIESKVTSNMSEWAYEIGESIEDVDIAIYSLIEKGYIIRNKEITMIEVYIKNLKDLYNFVVQGKSNTVTKMKNECEHDIYKYTDCGASILFDMDGITLHSIVEGSDAEITADKLYYPFTKFDYETTIDWIESEVNELYMDSIASKQLKH